MKSDKVTLCFCLFVYLWFTLQSTGNMSRRGLFAKLWMSCRGSSLNQNSFFPSLSQIKWNLMAPNRWLKYITLKAKGNRGGTVGEERIRGFWHGESMVKRDSKQSKWSGRFFFPLGQQEGWFHGWLWLRVKNPGALKIHLNFLDGNSLQFYIQNYFFFIWKKMELQGFVYS